MNEDSKDFEALMLRHVILMTEDVFNQAGKSIPSFPIGQAYFNDYDPNNYQDVIEFCLNKAIEDNYLCPICGGKYTHWKVKAGWGTNGGFSGFHCEGDCVDADVRGFNIGFGIFDTPSPEEQIYFRLRGLPEVIEDSLLEVTDKDYQERLRKYIADNP